jgi:hypothetical protein
MTDKTKEQARKEILEEVKKEIIKRGLENYMGFCYSIEDINKGIGITLLKWLEKLGEKKQE